MSGMRNAWTIALLVPLVLGAGEESLEQRLRRITTEAWRALGAGELAKGEVLAEAAWRLALEAGPQRPDFAEGVQIAADFDFGRGLEKRAENRVRNALTLARDAPVSRVKLSLVPEPPPAPFSQAAVNLRLSSGASIDEVLRLLEPARSHYPNLLLNVASSGAMSQPDQASRFLGMQQELVEAFSGPGAQLPILRAQIERSRDDDRLQRELREQQFQLIEKLKGPDALELLAAARELANA